MSGLEYIFFDLQASYLLPEIYHFIRLFLKYRKSSQANNVLMLQVSRVFCLVFSLESQEFLALRFGPPRTKCPDPFIDFVPTDTSTFEF